MTDQTKPRCPRCQSEQVNLSFNVWTVEPFHHAQCRECEHEVSYVYKASQKQTLADFAQFFPAQPDDGWIRCEERLPVPSCAYNLIVINDVVQFMPARWLGNRWQWLDSEADLPPNNIVTHWRPLPAPPGKGKE